MSGFFFGPSVPPGSGASTKLLVTQTAHGFSVGDVLYRTGGAFAKAIATSGTTAEVYGMVSTVVDANTFILTTNGFVSGLSGLTDSTTYFLSTTVAGGLQTTDPSAVGQVSKPIFKTLSTTSGFFDNYRGEIIAVGTPAVSSVTGLNTDNSDPINPVVKISVDGVTITGDGTSGSPLIASTSSGSGYPVWDAGTTYIAGDIVTYGGNAYQSTTTQSGNQPDLDVYNATGNWNLILNRNFTDVNIQKNYYYVAGSGNPQVIGDGTLANGLFFPIILANTLKNTGDKLIYKFAGRFDNFNNGRRLGIYLGSGSPLNDIPTFCLFDSSVDFSNTQGILYGGSGMTGSRGWWVMDGVFELTDIENTEFRWSTSLQCTMFQGDKFQNTYYGSHLSKLDPSIDNNIYVFGGSDDGTTGDITLAAGYIKFEKART